MAEIKGGLMGDRRALQFILLFSSLVLLPGFYTMLFGWIYFFVPSAVLFAMYRWQTGFRLVLGGALIGLLCSTLTGTLAATTFAVFLSLSGFMLARSALQADPPALSGLKGSATLIGLCLLALLIQSRLFGANAIDVFLETLNLAIDSQLSLYRQSGSLDADTMAILEQSLNQTKVVLPRVLPALLCNIAIFVSWFTMLLGTRIVCRLTGYQPWPDYTTWQIPDRLIWLFIAAALLLVLPQSNLGIFGINLLIVLSLIYIIQGFSILAFFLHRWNAPPLLRLFIYGLMLFQSIGTVLLLATGIADVWFDIRRIRSSKNKPSEPTE